MNNTQREYLRNKIGKMAREARNKLQDTYTPLLKGEITLTTEASVLKTYSMRGCSRVEVDFKTPEALAKEVGVLDKYLEYIHKFEAILKAEEEAQDFAMLGADDLIKPIQMLQESLSKVLS